MDMNTNNLFDTLSGLAPLLRVRPELQSLCRFGAQWKCDHEAESGNSARFHIVTSGTCVIDLVGLNRSIQVSAGDVVVLPRGARHIVRGPTLPWGTRSFPVEARADNDGTARSNTIVETQTELVCGRLHFEQAHQNL